MGPFADPHDVDRWPPASRSGLWHDSPARERRLTCHRCHCVDSGAITTLAPGWGRAADVSTVLLRDGDRSPAVRATPVRPIPAPGSKPRGRWRQNGVPDHQSPTLEADPALLSSPGHPGRASGASSLGSLRRLVENPLRLVTTGWYFRTHYVGARFRDNHAYIRFRAITPTY